MRRGHILHRSTPLDILYHLPKDGIHSFPVNAFIPYSKMQKTRIFPQLFGSKIQSPTRNLCYYIDPILRGFWPDWAETNFRSPSFIYLETTLTEFFCNLSVLA